MSHNNRAYLFFRFYANIPLPERKKWVLAFDDSVVVTWEDAYREISEGSFLGDLILHAMLHRGLLTKDRGLL